MSEPIKSKSRGQQLEYLKMCARSIERNADDLIGDQDYTCDIFVSIHLSPGEGPSIEVHREFIPEEMMNL